MRRFLRFGIGCWGLLGGLVMVGMFAVGYRCCGGRIYAGRLFMPILLACSFSFFLHISVLT